MRKLIQKLVDRLPPQFRILYGQFLLRVVDLESLSIQADIPRFLGQFAGILIMISVIRSLGFLMSAEARRPSRIELLALIWRTEQSLVSSTLLVAGLVAVVSID
jgi:hypothetical protein